MRETGYLPDYTVEDASFEFETLNSTQVCHSDDNNLCQDEELGEPKGALESKPAVIRQLWVIDHVIKHAKATLRTLYMVASTPSACRGSESNQEGVLRRGSNAHIHQRRAD